MSEPLDDSELIERTVRDLGPRCTSNLVHERQFFACDRAIAHVGMCESQKANGRYLCWWGGNDPPYPGAWDKVWETTDYVKHRLVDRQLAWPPKMKTSSE